MYFAGLSTERYILAFRLEMGNVPTKLDEEGTGHTGSSRPRNFTESRLNQSSSTFDAINGTARPGTSARHSKRRSSSIVNHFLTAKYGTDYKGSSKKHYTAHREQFKEDHAKELIVRHYENVDGGFLAPNGCYGFDKLDYDTNIVKRSIKKRLLAPFYLPLQDFNENWTDEEIIKIVDGLPLHSSFTDPSVEFEDIPIGDLRASDFDYLINSTITSKREQKKIHNTIFKARLYKKRILWQEEANELFLENKLSNRSIMKHLKEDKKYAKDRLDMHLPSDSLKLYLYKDGVECPICFLYFPKNLNYSKCCQQPICTECFVLIKRAPPHFPHDDSDDTKNKNQDDSEKDPHLLISETANCPYCATPNFTISYTPLSARRTGYGGVYPIKFEMKDSSDISTSIALSTSITPLQKTDSSLTMSTSASSTSLFSDIVIPITADTIRPEWEAKLNKERSRLDRRAANATAIHVSNRLITTELSENGEPSTNLKDLEDQMIEQAIRLSLKDNEKCNNSSKKKNNK